ncbi:MAG: hypothetical protein ACR2PB_12210 [Desulfocapsaceae bacterium]
METYTAPKPFEDNPGFQTDRQIALSSLDVTLIDDPLVGLIDELNKLPYLFTLQCCHGHFLTTDNKEISDFDLLGASNKIEYRLAYIAFCIENSPQGKAFSHKLKNIPLTVDRSLVQFCSAQWFWDQWVNSYALQLMPQRFKDKDSAVIDYHEARELKRVRGILFTYMRDFTDKILEQTNIS